MSYRWSGDTRRVRHGTGEVIQRGQFFEPTDHELRAFSGEIENVPDEALADEDDESNEDTES